MTAVEMHNWRGYILQLLHHYVPLPCPIQISPEHEQIKSLTTDVRWRYHVDVPVNLLSFHRRAVSQTITIKVVLYPRLLGLPENE